MSSEQERKDKIQGGVAGEDAGGQGRIWNRQKYGGKQGRKVAGTMTSAPSGQPMLDAGNAAGATAIDTNVKQAREARIQKCISKFKNNEGSNISPNRLKLKTEECVREWE